MKSQLAPQFHGNKLFLLDHFTNFKEKKSISDEEIFEIFKPSESFLETLTIVQENSVKIDRVGQQNQKQASELQDGQQQHLQQNSVISQERQIPQQQVVSLLPIYAQFIRSVLSHFADWEFEKLSSLVEISNHVFIHSFEKSLDKKSSFEYFSTVLVRHTLFRPPHTVHVFNYEESTKIVEYFLGNFYRFYQQYRALFQADLEQNLYTIWAGLPPQDKQLGRPQPLVEAQPTPPPPVATPRGKGQSNAHSQPQAPVVLPPRQDCWRQIDKKQFLEKFASLVVNEDNNTLKPSPGQ